MRRSLARNSAHPHGSELWFLLLLEAMFATRIATQTPANLAGTVTSETMTVL